MKNANVGEKIFKCFNYTILLLFAITAIYPLVYTLSMSLSTTREAARAGFHIIPREVSFMSFEMIFNNGGYWVAFANTVIRTVVGTFFAVLVTTMFAYALSVDATPHRKLFTLFALITMLFDGGNIPRYLVIKELGLIDNFLVYILPVLISAYNVTIARSFFIGLPSAVRESAKIDGANEFMIFFRIIIPMSKAMLMTVGLWLAVMHWNSWYDGMMYITSESKIVAQVFLQRIILEQQTASLASEVVAADTTQYSSETVRCATIIATVLPILCVYPFVQKYFIKGANVGAVKG